MDLLLQTDYLLKKTGLKPDKLKGQNFCVDEKVISQMVEAAQVDHDDEILEIGPGFGFLTLALLK
ncbi:MAG: 16S ribosomal RNA methyltransferase KsgA/Dim1 family protein, partial [Parcubacteria group bacterium GW2011_GWF2_45_11]